MAPVLAKKRPLDILVVEDDIPTLEILATFLERWGAKPRAAANAQEALDWARSGCLFDVIVSDYDMPGHDGLWLLRELTQLAPPGHRPRAVLLTGCAQPELARSAAQVGYDECLVKPIEAKVLLRAISGGE
jgi:CheY-like chemotaxis protein